MKWLLAILCPCAAIAQSGAVGAVGTYNSPLPSLTNGQQASLQLDSSGRLIVSDNLNFTYGTPPGFAASVAAVNAYVTGGLPVPVFSTLSLPPLPTLPKPVSSIPVTTNQTLCWTQIPADAPIAQAASAQIITGRPGLRILVCHVRVIAGAAEQTSEMEGTGTTCGTGTVYHSGSSTAANGEQLGANGGYESYAPFALLPGDNFCLQQAGTSKLGGKVSYLYIQ